MVLTSNLDSFHAIILSNEKEYVSNWLFINANKFKEVIFRVEKNRKKEELNLLKHF
jgi:hypothetical protein